MSDQYSAFASMLRQMRYKQSLSREELARKIGCDTRTIARWESGKGVPRPYYRQRLLDILQTDIHELQLPSPSISKAAEPATEQEEHCEPVAMQPKSGVVITVQELENTVSQITERIQQQLMDQLDKTKKTTSLLLIIAGFAVGVATAAALMITGDFQKEGVLWMLLLLFQVAVLAITSYWPRVKSHYPLGRSYMQPGIAKIQRASSFQALPSTKATEDTPVTMSQQRQSQAKQTPVCGRESPLPFNAVNHGIPPDTLELLLLH